MKAFQKIKIKITENFNELGIKAFIKAHNHEEEFHRVEAVTHYAFYGLIGMGIFLSMIDCAEAVTVDALKAPIQDLKKEIFGGWMMVVKIAAIAIGGIFSVVKQSLLPFGIGGGASAGIHFGDKWLGDGSAALI